MRHYELVVVLSPMLNQDEVAETWGRIKDFISNKEGEITHEERWGTRRLAYPIRKGSYQFLEGSYHLTRFSTDVPFNIDLHNFLRLDEQVLRSLVVVAQPPGSDPQALSPLARPAVSDVPRDAEPTAEGAAVVDQPATPESIDGEAVPGAETVVSEETAAAAESEEVAEPEETIPEEPVAEVEAAGVEPETPAAEEPEAAESEDGP